jgi:chemotaxis protein CheY-P-specific phosphatase CheC
MMNSEAFSESLQAAASLVLESTAFALIESPDDVENMDDSSRCETGALLRFAGPFSGALIAMTSEKLAGILAADMVGLEEEFSGLVDRNDAMKEILNIICGEFLPCIFHSQDDYSIESPINIAKPDFKALTASGRGEVIAKTDLIIEGEALILLLLHEP